MLLALWGRLSLRSQAAFAVLLPCTAVALFSSLYFPRRLNAQAQDSLEQKARALGALASAEVAPTLRLIADGLSQPEDLDNVFQGAVGGKRSKTKAGSASAEVDLSGTDVAYMAVVRGTGPEIAVTPGTIIRKAVHPDASGAPGVLPLQSLRVPSRTGSDTHACEIDNGEQLVVRCYVRDAAEDAAEGAFVAAFDKTALRAAQAQNLYVGIWSGVGAALLGLALAFVFGRALAGPVVRVTEAAKDVASGDLTVESVDVVAAGEIQSMASSFNEMLASLRSLVGQMVSLTGRLSGAAQGLIGASGDQQEVTSQQTAYAQEIAATFEELSRTAEQISSSTGVVETAARNTDDAVEQARAVVGQVVAGIQEMRGQSKEVADAISKLNADLQQVSKIAHVINSVAERSDLLALNAALEGTKAGEVGRGFSLVAAEMRKLAESVSGSARDIGRIVESVQESSNEAVVKAKLGVAASDRGVGMAEQASALFARIVELARGTSEAAEQISVATKQQRTSSEQAVAGARNVADLVKRGVDATSRTTGIAKDLRGIAEALGAVTSKFRVDTNGHAERPQEFGGLVASGPDGKFPDGRAAPLPAEVPGLGAGKRPELPRS